MKDFRQIHSLLNAVWLRWVKDTQRAAWVLKASTSLPSAMVSKYAMEKWEKERKNGLCAIVRGRSEEVGAVRNGLMLAASLPG